MQLAVAMPLGVLVAASALTSPFLLSTKDGTQTPRHSLVTATRTHSESDQATNIIEDTRQGVLAIAAAATAPMAG
ncbi:hypothetical protein DFR33_104113 [Bradymonas sediminis]|uniref:Uncharacterized protein n=1 Tax=Bradymonas sediminis TaxID=1548548 RepID=A0A2Z4FQ14_9DELT|nr:hypothetical protein DN745_17420 [Bradymonas sediminis]TDP75248.1 hypothetical protein DFR33_104113 [Bradymonas sediminis]